eukprot:TRINITY_DN24_c0_g1_i1.p1 TRINITY_DN24_c0_g1~~TRINITY_DN24_c0_g1_i1.p1  ORF type:complete len:297 (+),score=37.92 TRINITY_DN24_c0_g1_i1:28-891(+)
MSDDTTEFDADGFLRNTPRALLGDPVKIFKDQWREQLAEFWGTMIFVFLGTGTAIATVPIDGKMDASGVVAISFGFGFGLATMIYATANISGGHLNPAVTMGIMVAKKIPIIKALAFMFWQCTGAIFGTLIVKGAFPEELTSRIYYGATVLVVNATLGDITTASHKDNYTVDVGQAILMEITLTFLLVFTVFATAGVADKESMGKFAPLSIGLAVLGGHLVGVPFTGPSMNPARSFGPAVVSGHWEHHWLYWVGPMLGGISASLIYKYLFIHAEEKKATAGDTIRKW